MRSMTHNIPSVKRKAHALENSPAASCFLKKLGLPASSPFTAVVTAWPRFSSSTVAPTPRPQERLLHGVHPAVNGWIPARRREDTQQHNAEKTAYAVHSPNVERVIPAQFILQRAGVITD